MLNVLAIENIALIQSAELQFGGGFNVLTGETGAGKSIVVDAIGAVLGERTSRDLIRTGASSAVVRAVFSGAGAGAWLAENGVAPQGEELLLQRELRADGKNVCRVNGTLVTVAQLRQLGQRLLNIHGQHDGQHLLDPSSHLEYLDRFGGHGQRLAEYSALYVRLCALERELERLEMDEAERTRRVDTLTYQIGELDRAELQPGEDEELSARRTLLRGAGKLTDAVQGAYFALSGDDDSPGACALISQAEGLVRGVSDLSRQLEELEEKLTALTDAAEDAAEVLRDLEREFDFSPQELDEVESRLDILYRLKKKYGATVEEMLAYLERCREELEQIEDADNAIARLTRQREEALTQAREAAQALSQSRRTAADALRERVEETLRQLDMPKVCFQTEFSPKTGRWGLDETGADQVQFLMSANLGEELKPIQKVASGGELARIMLALKNVLAEDDEIGSLVFDEVDAGVSGRAARKVAEKMAELARHRQILCVTHLPQIAAMADFHLRVEKGEREGRTHTRVEELTREGRRQELARLIGGAAVTQALLTSAEELLTQAESHKKTLSAKA